MAAKTNKGLVEYAKAQLSKPYWYGCFGQKSTAALLTAKAKQYPALYTASRIANARNQYGVKVHDCIGLIKGYLWSDSATDLTPTYNAAQDKSANSMYLACKERGTLATMPDLEGILVFMNGHVGVYIGGGYVIEARGFSSGVVKTKLAGRGWTKWGKCPYITYVAKATTSKPTASSKPATSAKKSVEEIAKEVIAGKWGTGETRKTKLKAAGYDYDAVQKRVNELTKSTSSTPAAKKPTVGAKVKIKGKYATNSTAKSAGNSAAIGKTGYIVKIYEGKAFPYQIGAKKGDSSSDNTIGFAKATAFTLL